MIPDMTARHEKPETVKGRSRADVWFVLILTGGASATFQMWHADHADHAGGLFWIVAALVGIVPAATAIGLSHVVVSHKGAVWLRVVTVSVMLAIMAASASAVAATVHPLEVKVFNWVLALALDAAALACVWVLLGDRERKDAATAAMEQAVSQAAEARSEAEAAAGLVAGLEAELQTVRAQLEAERARRVPPRKQRRSSARKNPGTGTRNQPVTPAGSSAPEDVPDLDTEARILALIDQGHSASKAGILAGASDSYGRQVARLRNAAKAEPAGHARSDGDMAAEG